MHNFKKWFEINETANWGSGGWKIHLRTGTDNKTRDRAYEIVQEIIKKHGGKWLSKKLNGGEPDEKDITIYCGPKSEANIAAKAIADNFVLQLILKEPSDEMWKDDVEILPGTNVYGRFNASPLVSMTDGTEFHQYGCKGHSMMNSFVTKFISDRKNFNKKDACEQSYRRLKKLFGKDFTG
jgi:hypothetical protein